ncbi:LysR family pca operon transcriptional activator [Sagittula marina]|uniref:LysR family pca operon transcriptional activator n=1 Tax=Sagittula marina TaxID=943940 RepID=A0A7W6DJZ5_9RHOB|nr:LysR substrate-binding domain-containing protein [Sagittula marina]MBB3984142.1 LysR family pca operon transcriptional activator [Sagittula marina]
MTARDIAARLRMRHVRCFLTTARTGSMTAAAEEMHSSQPAVSRSLAELEALVGAPLFLRGGRELTLTEVGTRLHRHLDPAMAQIAEGLRPIKQGARVSVGMLPNVARTIGVEAAATFKAARPDVPLSLHWATVPELIERLNRGDIDMLLGRLLSLNHMEGVSFEHLFTEAIVFAVRADHPLAARAEVVTLGEVAEGLIVLPLPGTIIRRELDKFATARGINAFPNVIETVSFEFTRALLRRSEAVAAVPLGAIRQEIAAGEFVVLDITGEELVSSVGISYRTGRGLSPAAEAFAAEVRLAAKVYA